jgi:hypothetical protein
MRRKAKARGEKRPPFAKSAKSRPPGVSRARVTCRLTELLARAGLRLVLFYGF